LRRRDIGCGRRHDLDLGGNELELRLDVERRSIWIDSREKWLKDSGCQWSDEVRERNIYSTRIVWEHGDGSGSQPSLRRAVPLSVRDCIGAS
jgi:hypothetical protein